MSDAGKRLKNGRTAMEKVDLWPSTIPTRYANRLSQRMKWEWEEVKELVDSTKHKSQIAFINIDQAR